MLFLNFVKRRLNQPPRTLPIYSLVQGNTFGLRQDFGTRRLLISSACPLSPKTSHILNFRLFIVIPWVIQTISDVTISLRDQEKNITSKQKTVAKTSIFSIYVHLNKTTDFIVLSRVEEEPCSAQLRSLTFGVISFA